jgi:hypothetical protein
MVVFCLIADKALSSASTVFRAEVQVWNYRRILLPEILYLKGAPELSLVMLAQTIDSRERPGSGEHMHALQEEQRVVSPRSRTTP